MFERHSFFHRDLCQACVHVSCLAEAALLPQLTPLSSYGPLVPNAPVTNSPSHVTAVSYLLGYGANHVSLEVQRLVHICHHCSGGHPGAKNGVS